MLAPRFLPFGVIVPDGFVPRGRSLLHDKAMRAALKRARVVIAVWPDGQQELLFGGDSLTFAVSMGEKELQGGFFIRVEDEPEIKLVVRMMVSLKPMTAAQYEAMLDNTAPSRPRGVR